MKSQDDIVKIDPLYTDAVAFVKSQGHASCYAMMSQFKISYGRAVRLMDDMEYNEVVQPLLLDDDGETKPESGPRKLMTAEFKKMYTKYEQERRARLAERELERKKVADAAAKARAAAAVVQAPEPKKRRGKK